MNIDIMLRQLNALWALAIGSRLTALEAAGISGLTTNTVPKATSATAVGNSAISDDGANVTIAEPIILTGQTSTPGSATGTLTNAPKAGNAQTWLQISINGVVHWVPAWHA